MSAIPDTELRQLTLDPENWNELRELGHRMIDDMFDHLKTLRDQPAWQPLPVEVAAALREPLPRRPTPAPAVYQQVRELILPYTNGNRHPRAWGWVRGTGTPLAMLADMLASGMNSHMAGGQQAPTIVEEQTLRWMAELLGMPPATTGLLTSGGTMSNLLGLAAARNTRAGFPIRQEGLQGNHPRLVVYCSTETHAWIQKASELLGLGDQALRRIPVNREYQMNLVELRSQIDSDLAAGHQPIAVIANCGTVNTGAVDDLPAIASLCAERRLWFHVDGAFGALLKLSPVYSHLVEGVERADSLAFDLHKWMYLPFEIGCLLVRDPQAHVDAFATHASYLQESERGITAGGFIFADRGVELTRGFKALKLWMSLKTHGVDAYAALIEQNMLQARHLEHAVAAHPELEMAAPRAMNIVCFRYNPPDRKLPDTDLNDINRELVLRLQESGSYVVSGTVLGGRYAVRVANTNHRSRMEDFDALIADCVHLGQEIAGSWGQTTKA
jgi:glutamate/tyrosine decarboxylase-like PLP-dependent enzyme